MAATYLTPGVYVEEVPSGSATLQAGATAIAAFVGFTATAPSDDPADPEGRKPRLVTSWSQYEQLYGGFLPGAMLPHSVYGWFNNGGGSCYVVRIPHTKPSEEPAQLSLPAADRALGLPVDIVTKEPNAPIVIQVRAAAGEDDADETQPPAFDLIVFENGAPVETHEGVTLGTGARNVATVVNAESQHITITQTRELTDELNAALFTLKDGAYPVVAAAPTPVVVPGKEFAGSETARTGINGLVIADDVTMVMVPDLVNAARKEDGTIDLNLWKAVQTSLINHCEAQANRIAILDAPPGMSVQQIKEWRSDVAMYDSAFATMYYPWIKVENPAATTGDTEILIPPCGHMAGIWSRNDDTRGVWKAPANEIVRGALDVEMPLTKAEQGHLNPIGVNCIRPFGTRGIRVWGARTLASDTDWQYINVRRLFNMIEKTILDGTQWVVFEPNDQKLWEGVKRTISSFLRGLWRDGALFGATPDQAFYVKCDAETNPPDSIDLGKLVVEVGIAPVKPAEFVIFRISQFKDLGA